VVVVSPVFGDALLRVGLGVLDRSVVPTVNGVLRPLALGRIIIYGGLRLAHRRRMQACREMGHNPVSGFLPPGPLPTLAAGDQTGARAVAAGAGPRGTLSCTRSYASGRRTVATVPDRSSRARRASDPRCASTMSRARTKPMPDPSGFVVKNGTKRFV